MYPSPGADARRALMAAEMKKNNVLKSYEATAAKSQSVVVTPSSGEVSARWLEKNLVSLMPVWHALQKCT